MPFARDNHPGMEINDMTANGLDDTDKLVTDLHWGRNGALRPRIPIVDVDIRSANRRTQNTDQDVKLPGLRQRNFFQPNPRTALSF